MNGMFKAIEISLGLMLFQGCYHFNIKTLQDPSKEQFVTQLEQMYEKNIVDFFPPTWHDYSLSNTFVSYHSSPWDDSNESVFRCLAFFSDTMGDIAIDSLESLNYLKKMEYTDSVFTIDIHYMRYASAYRVPMKDSLQIPIPDMGDAYFSLGETTQEILFDDGLYTEKKEIIPEDLVVYILEADNGNFWKNKLKADEEDRPVLSTHWKHGYAKGIAVSRKVSRVCWWAIAW